ncbi:RNA polymerase sigma-70 factor (ECF subfamily) [Microbacterium sp. SLBN-154]|uniref:RNA polymerase sigma factor n=1 Tax=Microbacterium sp. SLBN-154 TaxID=2768458 RepID=UPI001153E758|nr:sigma-70 family RNA polymerase sigma factor [Microbacterium sp. SLBN-154]TQK20866.1 RNA polymerase sigma-70 factor (ECF subfamily) [Microbacterium sp. SLBN-154]
MSATQRTEQALWARAAGGEGDAFGELFDLHRDRVFRHGYRILRDTHDAEDAAAVAFLELWRRRRQVRLVEGSPLPWLLVTTTNVCLNLSRAKRRYRDFLVTLPHGTPVPSAEDTALDGLAADGDLAAALATLSSAEAELFALVAVEDYSITDAAAAVGVSPAAARTRVHRIRTKLRQHLGHHTLVGYLSKEAT